MKRTPLKTYTPLRSSSPLKRKTAMRQVSAKRRKTFAARRRCVAIVKARDKVCQARVSRCCTNAIDDVHEPLPRSAGGDPTDPAQCIGVCRQCHDWIGTNKSEAARLGLHKFLNKGAA